MPLSAEEREASHRARVLSRPSCARAYHPTYLRGRADGGRFFQGIGLRLDPAEVADQSSGDEDDRHHRPGLSVRTATSTFLLAIPPCF